MITETVMWIAFVNIGTAALSPIVAWQQALCRAAVPSSGAAPLKRLERPTEQRAATDEALSPLARHAA